MRQRCIPFLVLALSCGMADFTVAEEPRVFPYVLKYAWFDPHPTRHSEIHDVAIELEQPLSDTKRSVATIAYSYPKQRRISFQFAWDQPPQVIEMLEGRTSQTYAVSLEVRRGIGGEFVDESASIHVGSGGQSVDVSIGEVRKRLRVERLAPETYAENLYVGFQERNKHTGVQEGPGKFTLSGAGGNYINAGVLTANMRYAYLRITMETRGGYASAFYVYENAAAGTQNDISEQHSALDPDSSVEKISVSDKGSNPVLTPDFERGLVAPWGTGQYAADRAVWWNGGRCDSLVTTDQTGRHGGMALHILNRSPRAANVYGTTQAPLNLEVGKRYRITAWARANDLKSAGGASLVVDNEWKIRPIQLPQGTYGWTEFRGTFVAGSGGAQLRILSEDVGEVWFDDIQIVKD